MEKSVVALKKRQSTSPDRGIGDMKRARQAEAFGDLSGSFKFEHLIERPIIAHSQNTSVRSTPTIEFEKMRIEAAAASSVRKGTAYSSCSQSETPKKVDLFDLNDSLVLPSRNLSRNRSSAFEVSGKENSPSMLSSSKHARSVGVQRLGASKDHADRVVGARKTVACIRANDALRDRVAEKPVANTTSDYQLALKTCQTGDVKDCGLPVVTVHEVARLVRGELSDKVASYTIVDCRYPYEYSGGHIRNAINLYSESQLREHFFSEHRLAASPPVSTENSSESSYEARGEQQVSNKQGSARSDNSRLVVVEPTDNAVDHTDAVRAIKPAGCQASICAPRLSELEDVFDADSISKQADSIASASGCQSVAKSSWSRSTSLPEADVDSIFGRLADQVVASEKRNVIVFHCEFSQRRGPRLGQFLRNEDRQVNGSRGNWEALHYPECYLMDGGYKAFQERYAHLCVPHGYVPMNDERFRRQLSACEAERVGASKKRRTGLRNALFTEPTSASSPSFSRFELAEAVAGASKSARALLYSAPDAATCTYEKEECDSNTASRASFSL